MRLISKLLLIFSIWFEIGLAYLLFFMMEMDYTWSLIFLLLFTFVPIAILLFELFKPEHRTDTHKVIVPEHETEMHEKIRYCPVCGARLYLDMPICVICFTKIEEN